MDTAIIIALGIGVVILILLYLILQRLTIISAQMHAYDSRGHLVDIATNLELTQDRLSSIRSAVDQVEATLCHRLPDPPGIERRYRS